MIDTSSFHSITLRVSCVCHRVLNGNTLELATMTVPLHELSGSLFAPFTSPSLKDISGLWMIVFDILYVYEKKR